MEISDGEPEAWCWGVGDNLAHAGDVAVKVVVQGGVGGGRWSVPHMEFSRQLVTSLMTQLSLCKGEKKTGTVTAELI